MPALRSNGSVRVAALGLGGRVGGQAVAVRNFLIQVSSSQYWIIDTGFFPDIEESWYAGFNGLVSAHGAMAIVMTGTEFGPVRVGIDLLDREPELDLAWWDEVVDVSLHFEEAGAIGGFDGYAMAEPDMRNVVHLPCLSTAGPGPYRLRIHARGRDGDHARAEHDGEVEEHLIQIWPGPTAAENCHRLTDAYGQEIRRR